MTANAGDIIEITKDKLPVSSISVFIIIENSQTIFLNKKRYLFIITLLNKKLICMLLTFFYHVSISISAWGFVPH